MSITGIAFIGGQGPAPALCRRLAAEARRSGGLLIAAADSGLAAAEEAGLRPDWIVGDMDSLGELPGGLLRLEKYPPERVRRCPRDKDHTDTEMALELLREQGCGETWLAGGGGGRIDHLFALRALFEREPCPRRWITAAEDIRCVQAPARLNAAAPPESLVSVFPLGEGPWEAESRGLKWPLAGLPWSRGFFGVSNEAAGGFSVRALAGRFMVVLPLAA
ncbi:MAG: thiamine diphosphokinase [Treponema sp.]|jgi:thiamine pyrophosphokinase|nr:thiamine diphosphokinase [Treponema sp.]